MMQQLANFIVDHDPMMVLQRTHDTVRYIRWAWNKDHADLIDEEELRLFLCDEHYGDLTDTSNLTRILAEVQPDEVYNLGAQSHVAVSFESPEYTADVDAMGTLRLLDAIRFLGLEKKTKVMTADEKRAIAIHEAGHATISWMLEHANPLVKVTIVPRGEALGAAWYLPEERQLTNKDHLLDEMCSTLGGRAAEEVFLNQTSTGAINDLERVTKRAYAMVAYFGMSEKMPNMSYYDSSGNSDYGFTKPYSAIQS